MEIYDTEEEQVEALKRWWKENGKSAITGAILGIVAIVGWNFWQSYQHNKLSQSSTLYSELQEKSLADDHQTIEKLSERIMQQYSSTAYASYAALLLAKSKVQQGDLESAKSTLEKQMQSADSNEIRNIARIRLLKLMLATKEYEKGLQLIAEIDQSNAQGFAASYDELKGDLYVALDRLGEARTAYESAIRGGVKSPLLQFKLDDIAPPEIILNSIQDNSK